MDKVKEFVKKLGFTDKYLLISSIATGLFEFLCLAIFTFTTKDPILFATAAFGFLGTLVGFVVNKNKKENVAKITTSTDLTSTDDTNTPTI